MKAYARYHLASHAVVLWGVLTYAVAAARPGVAVLGAVAVAGAFWVFRTRVRSPLPKWLVNALLLAATLNMLRETLETLRLGDPSAMVTVLSAYLAFLQFIKLYESRTPRDQAQLLALSAMLVVGSLLTAVGLGVVLMLAVYTPLLLGAVLRYQLWSGAHRSLAGSSRVCEEAAGLAVPSGRGARRQLRAVAVVGLLVIATVGALVFVLMPRLQARSVPSGAPRPVAGASAGFSDHVQLGVSGLVSASPAIVMVADLFIERFARSEEGAEVVVTRLDRPIRQYFRGAVMDEYDDDRKSWRRREDTASASTVEFRLQDETLGADRLPRVPRDGRAYIRQEITLRNRPSNQTTLFSKWYPEQVFFHTPLRRGDRPQVNTLDGMLLLPPLSGTIRYDVRSDPGREADDRWVHGQRQPSFDAPNRLHATNFFREGLVRDYTEDVLSGAGLERDPTRAFTPQDPLILDAFVRHFREGFTYSLDLPEIARGGDPIGEFLKVGKTGHCEYFASAMTAMAQSIGIEARIVTGYASAEVDPDGSYIIRRLHAHAWVEALVLEERAADPDDPDASPVLSLAWRLYDPTPPDDLLALQEAPEGVFAAAFRLFDRIEQAYLDGVLFFGADHQSTIARGLGAGGVDGFLERFADAFDRFQARDASLAVILRFLLTFGVVFSLLLAGAFGALRLAGWAWRAAGRRAGRGGGAAGGPEEALVHRRTAFYRSMLGVLRRAGAPKPDAVPPLEFAERLGAERPGAAEHVEAIARLYYAVRYAGRALTPTETEEARRRLGALREALRPGAAP